METCLEIVKSAIEIDDKHPVTFIVDFASPFWATMWHKELIEMANKLELNHEPDLNFVYLMEPEA